MSVWVFTTTSGAAYDETQCNPEIKDGDILIVPNEGIVGFMLKAWPVALTDEYGKFHPLSSGQDSGPAYKEVIRTCLARYVKPERWAGEMVLTINRTGLEHPYESVRVLSPISFD